jgi:hypothetical protein
MGMKKASQTSGDASLERSCSHAESNSGQLRYEDEVSPQRTVITTYTIRATLWTVAAAAPRFGLTARLECATHTMSATAVMVMVTVMAMTAVDERICIRAITVDMSVNTGRSQRVGYYFLF